MNHTYREKSTKVLIVDDDAQLVSMLQDMLETEGYDVETCSNGHDALNRIREKPPMVMILDLVMPELDGWMLLRSLRSTTQGQRLPVIIMSGTLRPSDKLRSLGTTMKIAPTIALPKPFSLEDFERAFRLLGVPAPSAVPEPVR